jgi:hypothetical protein
MIVEYTILVPALKESAYYLGILITVLPLCLIYFAIREKRDKVNFGYMAFNEGMRTGVIITFAVAIVIVFATYVYFEFVNKGMTLRLSREVEHILISSNVQRGLIDKTMEFIELNYDLQSRISNNLLLIILGGSGISALSANILKKNKRKNSLTTI